MWNERKVGSVAGLEEDSHERDEAHHGVEIVRVQLTDDDEADAADHADEVNPHLLCPEIVIGSTEDEICDEATGGAAHNVEEAEHGCPAARFGLAEVFEVLEVVCAEDRVDGELTAERAKVGCHQRDGLNGAKHFKEFLHGRLLDDLVSELVDDLNLSSRSFGFCLVNGALLLLIIAGGNRLWGGRLFGKVSSRVNNVGNGRDCFVTVSPAAGRGVFSEQQHRDGGGGDQNERDDKGHAPRYMR